MGKSRIKDVPKDNSKNFPTRALKQDLVFNPLNQGGSILGLRLPSPQLDNEIEPHTGTNWTCKTLGQVLLHLGASKVPSLCKLCACKEGILGSKGNFFKTLRFSASTVKMHFFETNCAEGKAVFPEVDSCLQHICAGGGNTFFTWHPTKNVNFGTKERWHLVKSSTNSWQHCCELAERWETGSHLSSGSLIALLLTL